MTGDRYVCVRTAAVSVYVALATGNGHFAAPTFELAAYTPELAKPTIVAVISLLGHHGVPPDKALLFSVCFGLALAVGSLPGALVWLLYSFAPSRRSVEPGR